jgi:CheY-like chemotaxis protein
MQDKKRILIVDDDWDFREAVSCFLEANGFTVLRAQDGDEGVRIAKMDRPDLILMDIMMKERTEGFFAIREIRRDPALQHVPIFVLTSLCARLPDFQIPSSGGWLEHDLLLPKPVDTGQLLEKIREHVAKAG